MKSDIHIAEAVINDLERLIDMAVQAYKDHYTQLWKDDGESYLNTYFNYNYFKAYLHPSSDKKLYKIEFNQNLVGFLTLGFGYNESGNKDPLKMELERIYFIKEATGIGIGSHVVNFIEGKARSAGHQYIWLKAMKKSPAVPFYQKHGWEVTGETFLDHTQVITSESEMYVMSKDIRL